MESMDDSILTLDAETGPTTPLNHPAPQSFNIRFQLWLTAKIDIANSLFQSAFRVSMICYTLLPQNIRKMAVAVLIVLVVSPRLLYHAAIILTAFSLGVVFRWLAVDEQDTLRNLTTARLREIAFQHQQPLPPQKPHPDISHYPIPPPLDQVLEKTAHLIVQDFILSWFPIINHSQSKEFPSLVKSALLYAFYRLGVLAKECSATDLVVPLSQTAILHLREFREFEKYAMPLESYIRKFPGSPFARLSTPPQILAHLSHLSKIILKKGLDKKESRSAVVNAVMEEILTSSVLNSIVEFLSDPDVVNQALLGYLKYQAEQEKSGKMHGRDATEKDIKETRSTSSRTRDEEDTERIFIKGRHVMSAGLNELYCVVMCGDVGKKTRKVNAESNPIWLEEFTFKENKRKGVKGIVLDLYSMNILQDKRVGSINIHLSDLIPNIFTNSWYKLENTKEFDDKSIEIKLEIMHIITELNESMQDDEGDIGHRRIPGIVPHKLNPFSSSEQADITSNAPNGVITHPQSSNESLLDIKSDPSTRISLALILKTPELLYAFTTHLESPHTPSNAHELIHLYIMLDSFKKYSEKADEDITSLRQDAQQIFDLFFGKSFWPSVGGKSFNADGEFDAAFIVQVRSNILSLQDWTVFRELLVRLLRILDGFLESFFCSTSFVEVWESHSKVIRGAIRKASISSASPTTLLSTQATDKEGDVSVSPSTTHSTQDRVHILGNALATLREQVMIIDSQLDEQQDSRMEVYLYGERRRLYTQVERILAMIEEVSGGSDGVDLAGNVKIKVFDLSGDGSERKMGSIDENLSKSNGERRMSVSIEKADVEKSLTREYFGRSQGWILRFAIHIERGSEENRTVITKSFEEFEKIHELMCEQFIKIKALEFPLKPKHGYSGWSEAARTIRIKIAAGLEAWLVKLLGDELICESKILNQFLSDCSIELKSAESIEVRRRTRSELIGGKLMSAMKAAGSVVKTVAKGADGLADNFYDSESTPQQPLPRSTFSKDTPFDQISESDLEIILECVFTTVEEAFNLSDPDQWVRQKGLQLVKTLLRRTFGDTLTATLQSTLTKVKTAQTTSDLLTHLLKLLWPNDKFFKFQPIPVRSEQDQLDTKLEAKKMFVCGKLLPTEALVHVVGKYNTVNGLTRIFNMVQDRRLNRVLVCMWVDNIFRTLFDNT